MRKLIFFMHTSLDGFVAGINGEMGWINHDEEMFDFVATMTSKADTALYGRVTYQMMESYWPTVGDKPNASKHDIEHAQWYNKVSKIVISNTLSEKELKNTIIIKNNFVENIKKIKQLEGKDILIFGSPSASNLLLNLGLIDEFWIFVNPIILGEGIQLFKSSKEKIKLNLIETKLFSCGVIALHYEKQD